MTLQRSMTLWVLAAGLVGSSSAYAQPSTPVTPPRPGVTAPAPAKPGVTPAQAPKPAASRPPTRQQLEQLERLHERTLGVFEIPGVVFTDVNDRTGRFDVGVENPAAGRAARIRLIQLGIPADIIDVVITRPLVAQQRDTPKPNFPPQLPPFRPDSPPQTLRTQNGPLRGGLEINPPGFLCTLGFIAVRAGARGFVTNSHCTGTRGVVEGTVFGQGALAVAGTEEVDPGFPAIAACPAGRRCRFSDSAWIRITAGVDSDLGGIVRTASPNTGSLEITGIFRIATEHVAAVGDIVNKMGRTTGWTRGAVTRTGINSSVNGTNITLLGQVMVSANSGGGDSGAPVFQSFGDCNNCDVFLLGIHWGGDGAGNSTYSPIANVRRNAELGPLRNCSDGSTC